MRACQSLHGGGVICSRVKSERSSYCRVLILYLVVVVLLD